MSFTPYDWNQSIQTRTEYVEERLRGGSPVVALSIAEGILLASIHRAQRKIYEVYDRLVFAGIGNQSDVEVMRNAAIDFAHREGFVRSPDDVTVQRLVGSVLSPALKKAFGDPFTAPFVFRGLFVEVGERPEQDAYYALGFDGEFRAASLCAVTAGTPDAESQGLQLLTGAAPGVGERGAALRLALEAWAAARRQAARAPAGRGIGRTEEEDEGEERSLAAILREEIAQGTVEAALLERNTPRESKFRLLPAADLDSALAEYR